MRTIRMLLASVVCIRGRSRSQKGTVALPHVQVMSSLGAPETRFTCLARGGQGVYDLIHAPPAGEAPPLTRHLFSHLYVLPTHASACSMLLVVSRRRHEQLSTS